MYKLIIADDEPKIRRGLKNSLDWASMDIEIAGEAEDGEGALEIAEEKHPDIMLLDICMPFLNGLEMIKKLNQEAENCRIIIVTGYDEFKYVQEALKLKVFDYLLKPVNKQNLKDTVYRAIDEIKKERSKNNYFEWENKQVDENIDVVREKFFNSLLKGTMTQEEADNGLDYLNIKFRDKIGMFIIKIVDRVNIEVTSNKNWSRDLLKFALKNIILEELKDFYPVIVFYDEYDYIVVISDVNNLTDWIRSGNRIIENVEKYLKYVIVLEQMNIENGLINIRKTYENLLAKINNKSNCKPVTMLALRYIEGRYYENDLCLEKVAEKFNITPSYLSKLIKGETGMTFIDYLTKVRMDKAICIMDDPSVKMYEVAELVGYSNQYYFSKAFKKFMGFSPAHYKGGNID